MTRRLAPWALAAVPALLIVGAIATAKDSPRRETNTVLNHQVKDIDGKEVDLSRYKGDVLLIVNTASKCGYTPQYEGLEALYKKHKAQGFQVLAFPANQFGGQEPGTNAEIKKFCRLKYDVSFPVFSKIVVKGDGIHPLYQYLTDKSTDPDHGGQIKWNFTKFLVDRQGRVIARFEPNVEPESEELTKAVDAALAEAR